MAGAMRWMRALTLACVLVGTGVAGHGAAGGAAPGRALVVVLLVCATLVLAPLLGSPASPLRVVLLVVGGQAALHLSLSVRTTSPVDHSGAEMVMPSGSAGSWSMSDRAMVHGSSASVEASFAWLGSAHVGMLLAHLVAGLVLGLWLAAGERAVWTLLRIAARPVAEAILILLNAQTALVAASVGWTHGRAAPGWGREPSIRPDRYTIHSLSRRGPPRISVA